MKSWEVSSNLELGFSAFEQFLIKKLLFEEDI